MNTVQPASSNLEKKWPAQLGGLWPAVKGSLAKVRKPCIRKSCAACARGDKHPAWLFTFTRNRRRHCLYVPLGLVPRLTQAVKNGRQLEQLLYQAGPALIKEYRLNQKKMKANK